MHHAGRSGDAVAGHNGGAWRDGAGAALPPDIARTRHGGHAQHDDDGADAAPPAHRRAGYGLRHGCFGAAAGG